jgi:hypothetical protein
MNDIGLGLLVSWDSDWLQSGRLWGQSLSPSSEKILFLLYVIQTVSGALSLVSNGHQGLFPRR